MTTHKLSATFEVKSWDEHPVDDADGPKVTRADVVRSYDGDVDGESHTEWLMAYGSDETASFVGIERMRATIDGKRGSFAVQHVGTFDGGTAKAALTIVPGSATDELEGMTGKGRFTAAKGPNGKMTLTVER